MTEALPDSLLSLDTGNQAKSVVQRMYHPLNSLNSARSRLYKSMSAAGRHMREQQVHPPLAVALQMIPESHKCDGKGSVEGQVPSPAEGCTRPTRAQHEENSALLPLPNTVLIPLSSPLPHPPAKPFYELQPLQPTRSCCHPLADSGGDWAAGLGHAGKLQQTACFSGHVCSLGPERPQIPSRPDLPVRQSMSSHT